MRIVIDGTAGCGKTTFLSGVSSIDLEGHRYTSITDMGYTVFTELIRGTVRERRKKASNPFDDWYDFFEIAMNRSVEFYNAGESEKLCFYDRGVPYLKAMANRYSYKIQDRYYDCCRTCRYDSPVFVFSPILSYDMRNPKPHEERNIGFTKEERIRQHSEVIGIYRDLGYDVVDVPVFVDGDPEANNIARMKLLREYIEI